MLDIEKVIQAIPRFETFCSVKNLHTLVEKLRAESADFEIEVAGTSANGVPIHHVRFGRGSVKALVVAFPHCSEPVGSLTVFSLLTLLHQRNKGLIEADVEWHIVPCIDPDGAILNEGWSQKEFSFTTQLKNFYKQELRDQADCSFPIKYKQLAFDQPTKEAKVLQRLLTEIQPDFYFSLHNAVTGGAFFTLTRNIDQRYHRELYALLDRHHIPLQLNLCFGLAQFAPGIWEMFYTRKFYDFLGQTAPHPEELLNYGATSWEYLADIKASAMAMLAEIPQVKHPSDGSKRETKQNLRQLKLRMDADNKFVVTVILDEWEKVKGDLDSTSPFYKKIFNGMVSVKDTLHDGLPWWPDRTRDILFNPAYRRAMTEGERFNEYGLRYYLLCNCYEFVRLLKASKQTTAVQQAIERLEAVFDQAMDEIATGMDLDKLEVIDCQTLAKAQLGSGLIVLNSILETRGRAGGGNDAARVTSTP